MYNFNHLYYFYITVKSDGVTTAAKHLKVSQPSLSSQIKVLEEMLGKRLFRKVGRKNQLTETGQLVYGYCRRMFELSEEMNESLLEGDPTSIRRIAIGVSNEVERSFVVEVVSLFLKKHGIHQRPRVTMVAGSRTELVERLRFRELDAVVTPVAVSDPEVRNLKRAEVPVALICSSQLKLDKKILSLKSLSTLKALIGGESAHWVMPSSKFTLRSEIDLFFEENDIKGRIVFESDVMASLVRSIVDDIGVAFLPLLFVLAEIQNKSVRVLGPKEGFWKYRVWLSCHEQNKDDSLILSLADSFGEVCDLRQ